MTYRPLTHPEMVAAHRGSGMAQSLRRLARLGVSSYELGVCEHGPVAKARVQIGRAHKTLNAHGAKSYGQALDSLIEGIEKERRK